MAFRERLDLLAIYKNALEFIPLKPPMEHYYVTSKYGKRKHPVTKKWRFHHGIDLAGTWQENIKGISRWSCNFCWISWFIWQSY